MAASQLASSEEKSVEPLKPSASEPAWLKWGAMGLFTVIFLYHWMQVWMYAIDIPFWDEWRDIAPTTAGQWLWRQEGEHRMPTVKLMVTALFHLNGWDFSVHQTLNFAIFGVTVGSLYLLLRRGKFGLPVGLAVLLLVFPLSPRAAEVHHWAITVHYHFALLFLFGAIYFLFREEAGKQLGSHLALGVASGILSIYSFGVGFSALAVVLVTYSLFKLKRMADPAQRGRELGQWFGVAFSLVLAYAAYFIDFHKAEGHPPLSLPISRVFWDHFMTLISFGMGFQVPLPLRYAVGAVYLVLIVLPWILFARQVRAGKARWDAQAWTLLTATLCISAACVGTSMGRAATNEGYRQAEASRYTEVTMMLIPLIGASWWLALAHAPKLRTQMLAGYVALSAVGFALTWKAIDSYEATYLIRQIEGRNLSACYARRVPCEVVNLYPIPIEPELLDQARAQKFSFMDKVVRMDW